MPFGALLAALARTGEAPSISARAIEGETAGDALIADRAAAVIAAATRSRSGHVQVTVADLDTRRRGKKAS